MFAADLAAIDRLRTDAIHVQEPHESGIRKLCEYAAQLQWMGAKFPIDVGLPPPPLLLLPLSLSSPPPLPLPKW